MVRKLPYDITGSYFEGGACNEEGHCDDEHPNCVFNNCCNVDECVRGGSSFMFPFFEEYTRRGVDLNSIPDTNDIQLPEPVHNNNNHNDNNDNNNIDNNDNYDNSYSPAESNNNISIETPPKTNIHTKIKVNKNNKGAIPNSNTEHNIISKPNDDMNKDSNNDINTETISAVDVSPEVNSNENISSNENSNGYDNSKNENVIGHSNVSTISVNEYNEKSIDEKGIKSSIFTISIASIVILCILGGVLSVMVIRKRMRNKKLKEINDETIEDNCEPFPPFKPDRHISDLKDPVESCEEYLNSLSRLKYKSPNGTYGKNNNNLMPSFPFFVSPTLVSADSFISNNPNTNVEAVAVAQHPIMIDPQFENNNKTKELDESLRPTIVITSASENEDNISNNNIQPSETEENTSNNNIQPSEIEESTSQLSIQITEEESTTIDNTNDISKTQTTNDTIPSIIVKYGEDK